MRRQDVEEHFNKLFRLTGRRWPEGSQEVYLDKLQKYELEDFIAACSDDDALEEITRFGFNWPVLKRHIERMKGKRLADSSDNNLDDKKRFNMNKIPDALKKEIEKIKGFSNE